MEGDRLQTAFRNAEAAMEQRGGDVGTNGGFVSGKMVRMGMGDKGARLRVPWVKPQVWLRQVEAALESDFDQAIGIVAGFPLLAKGNRSDRVLKGSNRKCGTT